MDSLRKGVVAAPAGIGAKARNGGEVKSYNCAIVALDSSKR